MIPDNTRAWLEKAGVHPAKRMGQNFLMDGAALSRIAGLAVAEPCDFLLEIGAGTGNLTARLLEREARVVALERDRRLVAVLSERFGRAPGLTVVAGDVLAMPIRSLLAPGRLAVAGNIPYSLTGEIVRKLADDMPSVCRAVLTVQKEVARRLCAAPGDREYSAFTILTAARFVVSRGFDIPAGAFMPRPEVDSSVIVLSRPLEPAVKPALYPLVRRLVHEAFGQRRKTLANSLHPFLSSLGARDEMVAAVLLAAGLDPGQRPETVPVEKWELVARAVRGVIR